MNNFLPLLRELVRAYQAFEACSSHHIRVLGLTTSQFDVIATLGNTPGLTCGEIGEKTLMVKGTLTGVLDRLERKELIQRHSNPQDKRSFMIALTPQGTSLFERVFPLHLAHLSPAFAKLSAVEQDQLRELLIRLRQGLTPEIRPAQNAGEHLV